MSPKDADDARVAEAVRAFYEQHPYPPPVESLDAYRRRWQDREATPRRLSSFLACPALYRETIRF